MVHLVIHLPEEAILLGGPVHYRWMYPIERAMAPGTRATRRVQPDSTNRSDGLVGETEIRRRGVAANNVVDKYKKLTGIRPKVVFNDGLARPVGKWAKEFTTEVGIACRMFAPLTCKNWKEVDVKARKNFHEHILENFDVDIQNPHVVKIVNKFLAQRLREHRCRLHKYYKDLEDSIDKRQRIPKKCFTGEMECSLHHF